MATISKTENVSVLTLQSVAASSVLISSAIDVSTKFAATGFIHFGRRTATAAGAGVKFRWELSSTSSGNGDWYSLDPITTDFFEASTELVLGAVGMGNVITVASTTGFEVGDIIYIANPTIANSEWARIRSVVLNTSVTIEDDLLHPQTDAQLHDRAEMFVTQFDLTAVKRIRLVADGSLFNRSFAVESYLVTAGSIG